MQKVTLTIRVDASDLEEWKRRADGNLSAWIRERLNEKSEPQNLRATEAIRMGGRSLAIDEGRSGLGAGSKDASESVQAAKVSSARTCKHGTPKGFRCWKCGGPAIIEKE